VYSLEIPAPGRESSDALDYECAYSVSGSVLNVHRALKIKKNTVPLYAWSEYDRVLAAVNANFAQFVKVSPADGSTQAG